jgi:hypothetical protein
VAENEIDPATGTFKDGRFKGMAPEDVAAYAQTIEEVARAGGVTPPPVQIKRPAGEELPAETPEQRLARVNAERTSPMNNALAARLVEDDKAQFIAQVKDYDKYSEDIEKLKKTLSIEQLVTPGLHRTLYIAIKGRSKLGQEALFKAEEPPPPPPDGEEHEEQPPVVPPTRGEGTTPKQPVTPKAVPPTMSPTPGGRTPPPPKEEKSKLKPNEKLIRFCKATGQDVNKYLLKLEQQGRTQEDVDALERAGEQPAGGAYGRKLATRR